MASHKVSNINLYSADNLDEKALHIVSVDALTSFVSPNPIEFQTSQVKLSGHANASHDIDNLGVYLDALTTLQASDSVSLSGSINNNASLVAALTITESTNHTSNLNLVNAFNAARVIDIATLTSDLAAEAVTARSAELGNADGIAAQNLTMLATVDAETVRAQAAEVANADAIAALGVTDASTLASINTMLADYQGADNTISGLITALTTRVATLEGIVASLTA